MNSFLGRLFSKRLTRHLESERGAASLGFPAYIQVTSAFPSSCSKPPSSRWDRALGYPPPNTGNPPMPPAVGDSSSGGTGLLTARLTEGLDTSLCTDKAWRQEGHRNRSYIYHSQTDSNPVLLPWFKVHFLCFITNVSTSWHHHGNPSCTANLLWTRQTSGPSISKPII